MAFYDEMATLAAEMLNEFGADGVLVRSGPTIEQFNPETEQMEETAAPVEVPVRASVGPIAVKDAQGREVLKSVAVTLEKPLQGDKLVWSEMTFTIGTVTAVPLQGQIVVYMSEVV